ncbi:tape measure protein (plasmid) [Paracoccus denitrificans]|nr:tape measure protein [Paracoccus denitrificans]WQO35905.1 tape measure protein [Paracoccus denitrificans]
MTARQLDLDVVLGGRCRRGRPGLRDDLYRQKARRLCWGRSRGGVRRITGIAQPLEDQVRVSGLLAGGVAAQQVRQYMRLADAATQMQNSLRVAGLEGAELSRVYDQLFRSAQRNSAPINSLVDLYSKLALTQKELGVTGDDLIRFTDGIAVALKVAGTDAVSASGSLLQLSQALGGGVVRAEEFNSILEGTPTIAQAVARGLKEANGSVAELRKLVVDGQVSSTAFFRAFEAGSGELRRQAETSQTTVGQAFTRLGNSLVTVVGEFDKATGASAALAEGISSLGSGLDRFDAEGFISQLQDIADAIRDADEAGRDWLNSIGNSDLFKSDTDAEEWFNRVTNPDVGKAQDKIDLLEREIETLQAAIENNTQMGFDNSEALSRLAEVRSELAAVRAEAAALPSYFPGANMMSTGTFIGLDGYTPPPSAPSVEPVSIADHPAAPGKGGSKGRKKGGSGGRSRKEQLDDYAKEVKAIRERTAALEVEAASLLLVAESGEDYGDALEYARKRAELLHAAQKAGKQITPELSAEIDQLAQSYVTAGLNAEQAAEKLDQIKGATERGKNALEDMFGSIIDGSASAKDAVASLLAEIAKAQIMKGILGLPGMGSLSSTIGGLLSFDGGGFTGHGSRSGGIDGRGGFPAILHPNETVIDHTRGQGGSSPKITINNNAPGAVVSADYATKDEVILTVSQAIASNNRRQSDQQYLRGSR